jgi:hypothetical protein
MRSNMGPQRAASNPAKRDNSSLSLRNFVRVSFDFAQDHELVEWHLFEAAYQLVFVRPALAPSPWDIVCVQHCLSSWIYLLMPYKPGLGQGQG